MTVGDKVTKLLAVRTSGHWIGPEARPLMSWVSEPVGGAADVGVVIAPPLGYEYWSSHRSLRTLAERLAAQGCRVLRFDYDGTGDSSGDQWDPNRIATWSGDIARAAGALADWGSSRLVLIGLRVGATLSLMEGSALGADAVVAWSPVVRGRRYINELRLLGLPMPDVPDTPERTGIVVAGSVFSSETLTALGTIDLAALPDAPAPKVLVIDRQDKPVSQTLLDRLDELAVATGHLVCGGTEVMLDQPTEYATVPSGIIDEICSWVGYGTSAAGDVPAVSHGGPASFGWRDGIVEENVVHLGDAGLVGIETKSSETPRGTVLWLNSGSEHHVGPGRAWVEYARDLALIGFSSVRMDFSGWGESPDLDHAPGRPYDQHGISETVDAVSALRELGHERIVLAGLCAGAWIALKAVLDVSVDGVIAINPQLYWQPGDPQEADLVNETRVRRLPEIRRNKRLDSIGMWSLLDALGLRHPAAVWLKQLEAVRTPIATFFVEDDDGLEFLEDRTGRAWRRAKSHGIHNVMVPDIDHSMRQHWHRTTMIQAIADWLDSTLPRDGD